jgi:hypothetical protein
LALELYEKLTPRNGKYTADGLAARLRFEQVFLSLKVERHESEYFASAPGKWKIEEQAPIYSPVQQSRELSRAA